MQTCTLPQTYPLLKRLWAGALGGAVGGAVFGMMMWKMGMLTMIAGMMGLKSTAGGAAIHLLISVMFGLVIGLVLNWAPSCPGQLLLFSTIIGAVFWVVGPLIVMPLVTGGPLFAFTSATQASLVGHIIYVAITLLVAKPVLRQQK